MGQLDMKYAGADTILWTTKSFKDNIVTMAFITVESKAEVSMVKFLSSMNQILLIHCFIMMLLANLFTNETEVDLYEEGDNDESFLMERADSLSSLLPCLDILTMGAVAVAGSGRRFLIDIQQ